MKTLTAKAFEHANVTGKKLQYIRITNGKEEVIINVGMKTFEGVTKLEQNEEQITPQQLEAEINQHEEANQLKRRK